MRGTALVLLTGYLLFVGWLMLRPLTVMWVEPSNLEPFASLRADLREGTWHGLRVIGSGLLLLAPLGVLVPALGSRLGGSRFMSFAHTVFAGAVVSLAIELLQSMVPSQVANVDALMLNTFGVALVHLLCYGRLRALLLHRRRPPATRTALGQEPAGRGGRAPAQTPSPAAAAGDGVWQRVAPGGDRLDGSLPVL
ncbi:VanZ family protein [Streptomyces aidingensis]|uniref:Glycopeptide antibiotics resistance protein n=1 Tax=Streptomyces aidingensis TaxID=910347 RepID=A0A1I1EHV3_9ACTN|nr:VanZ family protein [Streptomyces aidingensis]SFB86764.1 Glycopeptide antibiotics resistance protein [Streptomyces aidingensis]